jgi:mannose-6-phosphate isomerase-like protein (cupin superfamily)
MYHVLRRADQQPRPNRTILFEGERHRAGVSFFLIDYAPGERVRLHRHPYPETWIVRSGRAAFTVGAQTLTAADGDIVTIDAGTPHGFRNAGAERLELVCLHPSDRVVQEWVEEKEAY